MDTSIKYKNMCNKAEEIQRKWKPKIGDFWGCNCSSCLDEKDPIKQTSSGNVGRAWVISQGDWIAYQNLPLDRFYRDDQQAAITSRDFGFGIYWKQYEKTKKRGFVWLPRQDQLEYLLSASWENPITRVQQFHYFCNPKAGLDVIALSVDIIEAEKDEEYVSHFSTLEQLWLVFVMDEIWEKRWDFKEGVWNAR